MNPARLLLALMLCFAAVPGRADEGMWMINALDAALVTVIRNAFL